MKCYHETRLRINKTNLEAIQSLFAYGGFCQRPRKRIRSGINEVTEPFLNTKTVDVVQYLHLNLDVLPTREPQTEYAPKRICCVRICSCPIRKPTSEGETKYLPRRSITLRCIVEVSQTRLSIPQTRPLVARPS